MTSANTTTAIGTQNVLPMRRPSPSTGDHLSFSCPQNQQQQHSSPDQLHQLLLQLIPSLDAARGTNEGEQREGGEGEKQKGERGDDDATTSTADDSIELRLASSECNAKISSPDTNQPKALPSPTLKVTPFRTKEQQQKQQKRPFKKPKGWRQQRLRVSPIPPQSSPADQMPMFPQQSDDQHRFVTTNSNEFITALQQFFSTLEIPGPSSSSCQPSTAHLPADRMMSEMSKEAQQLLEGMAELAPNANAEELLNAASLAMAAHLGALVPQLQNSPMDELLGPLLWQSLFQSVATGGAKEADSGIGMEQEETDSSQNGGTTNDFFALPPHPPLSSILPLSFSSVSNDFTDQCPHPSALNPRELIGSCAKALASEECAGDSLDATVLTALWLGMAQQQQGDTEAWEEMLRQAVENVQGQKWDGQQQWKRDNGAQTPTQRDGQSPPTNDQPPVTNDQPPVTKECPKNGAQTTASPAQCNENGAQKWAMTSERHTAQQMRKRTETNEQSEVQSGHNTAQWSSAIGGTEGKARETADSEVPIQMAPLEQIQLIGMLPLHLAHSPALGDSKKWHDAQKEIEFGVNRRKNPREGRHRAVAAQRTNAVAVPPLSTVPGTGTLTAKSEKSLGALLRQQPEGAERAEELDELEEFANFFKKQRIKHGFTQGDVGVALGKRYGTDFSQTTISRFEALNLSFKNMCKLRPLLQDWLEETDRLLSTGATVQDVLEGVALQKVASIVAAADHQQRQSVPTDLSLPPFGIDEDNNGPSPAVSKVLPPFKKRRKRTNLDTAQKLSLDAFFRMDARPDNHRMNEIATLLDLDQDVVRVWFCNRRQKLRKL